MRRKRGRPNTSLFHTKDFYEDLCYRQMDAILDVSKMLTSGKTSICTVSDGPHGTSTIKSITLFKDGDVIKGEYTEKEHPWFDDREDRIRQFNNVLHQHHYTTYIGLDTPYKEIQKILDYYKKYDPSVYQELSNLFVIIRSIDRQIKLLFKKKK